MELDLEKLKNKEYTLTDLLEIPNNQLGIHNSIPVYLKSGKYGPYVEWSDKRESIKHIGKPLENIELTDVLHLIDKTIPPPSIDPNAPRTAPKSQYTATNDKSIIRIIDSNTSIRRGKFGMYVYYKTPEMGKPEFFSMKSFKGGPAVCDLMELRTWLKDKYDIPRE
jgi:topoisomerase IA-like protein